MSASRLSCGSGLLEYRAGESLAWELPVSELAVVGEYTMDHGPSDDDYFLVFVATSGSFLEASFYAEGRDECLRILGQTLGTQLACRLRQSTTFRSQVLWPKVLLGAPLFASRTREARGLFGKLWDAVGVRRHERELSRAVRSHAQKTRR